MATSREPVDLNLVSGLPYNRRFRIQGGASIWSDLDKFEVRSDVRAGKTSTSALLWKLSPFLKASIEASDIVINLEMTGEDTRGKVRGYYDIVVSDVGPQDARALPVASGKVKVGSTVTAGSDD